jgi:hypothetical protein
MASAVWQSTSFMFASFMFEVVWHHLMVVEILLMMPVLRVLGILMMLEEFPCRLAVRFQGAVHPPDILITMDDRFYGSFLYL